MAKGKYEKREEVRQATQENEDFAKRIASLDKEQASWRNVLLLKKQIRDEDTEIERLDKKFKEYGEDAAKSLEDYLKTSGKIKTLQEDRLRALQAERVSGGDYSKEIDSITKRIRDANIELKDIREKGGEGLNVGLAKIGSEKKSETSKATLSEIEDVYGEKSSSELIMKKLLSSVLGKSGQGKVGEALGLGEMAELETIIGAIAPELLLVYAALTSIGDFVKTTFTTAWKSFQNITDEISNSVYGGGSGLGGGKVSGKGASNLLDGFAAIASTIPIIGGLLKDLYPIFKTLLEFGLGIDQANVNISRSLNMSISEVINLRKEFQDYSEDLNNVVVNTTRMFEIQQDIGKQFGINNIFSKETLATAIELKDVMGLEDQTIKSLTQSSLLTGTSVKNTTKEVLGQVEAFKGITGISFNQQGILAEIGRLSGVIGLKFAEYPEKLTSALLTAKSLGFSLQDLNRISSSFLDFEKSIQNEFEAQVLTGKDLNLEKAREAALNGDLASLSREITRQVGSAHDFLKLNVIAQESLANAVGMTRDELADTLKNQEAYSAIGAKDLKQAEAKLQVLRAQGLTEKEINKMLGEDAYNTLAQTSAAENLNNIFEKLKISVVNFLQSSHLLDYFTDPDKLKNLISYMVSGLATFIKGFGSLVADVLKVANIITFGAANLGKDAEKVENYTDRISDNLQKFSVSGNTESSSIGEIIQNGENKNMTEKEKQESTQKALTLYANLQTEFKIGQDTFSKATNRMVQLSPFATPIH